MAERFNRTLFERVRAMLLDSEKDVVCGWTGVYLLNRSPTTALSINSTPAELWLEVKPNLGKLRIFGCRAFAWILGQLRKKLDAKSFEVVMVGYAPNGYRLWDRRQQKIIVARDVKLDETRFPYEVEAEPAEQSPLVVRYSYEKEEDEEVVSLEHQVRGTNVGEAQRSGAHFTG